MGSDMSTVTLSAKIAKIVVQCVYLKRQPKTMAMHVKVTANIRYLYTNEVKFSILL